MHKCVLRHCKFDSIRERLLLGLELNDVVHHAFLQVAHEYLLILCELLDEALERLSRLSLRGLRPSAEKLRNTVLQYLVDEILVTKCFLLLCMLTYDAHDLTEAVWVINRHFYSSQRLSLMEKQVYMCSHL